jgi:hypothetical protein
MNELLLKRPNLMIMPTSSIIVLLIVIFGGCLTSGSLQAQQTAPLIEKVPPPPPPYVNQAGSGDGWIIHFPPPPETSGSALPGVPKRKTLKEIDVAKVDDKRREISVWNDGSTSQHWYYKGVELSQNDDSASVSASNPFQSGADNAAKAKSDFIDFAWITLADFVGKTKKDGRDCYYYQRAASSSSPANSQKNFMMATPVGATEAWINIETSLPVAIKDSRGERTYQFTGETVSSLTLPPMFQAEYDRYTKALASLKHYQANAPR